MSLGLHLLANCLVWLSLSSNKEVQSAVLQELSSLPRTHAVSSLSSTILQYVHGVLVSCSVPASSLSSPVRWVWKQMPQELHRLFYS